MAKVSYVNIPPELEDLYKKGLQPGDRFTFSRIRVKDVFLSRARIKGITEKSLLVSLAPVWQSYSDMEKAAWTSAGVVSNETGFKMFVNDTAARRKVGLSGFATPNNIYQATVGRIAISSPATTLQIEQAHPLTYYVLKKITGTRSQYAPVLVTEPFSFPLEIGLAYKTDLTSLGVGSSARMFARLYSNYQGTEIQTDLEISFGLSDDWQISTASISSVKGLLISYSVFIEVNNCTGNLYFDNVIISHSGENWARDPHCLNVSQNFTKAFFQVAKHWVATDISDGADFGSFYYS